VAVDYRAAARQAAIRAGIDPRIFERQIGAESGFDPTALSPAGAIGIAQIMPRTAAGWHVNPRDPIAALNAAAVNMGRYLKAFGGSWEDALEAYNAGPGAVNRKGPPKYAETREYVRRILSGANPAVTTAPMAGAVDPPMPVPGLAQASLSPAVMAGLMRYLQTSGRDAVAGMPSAGFDSVLPLLTAALPQPGPAAGLDSLAAPPPPSAPSGPLAFGADPGGGYGWADAFANQYGLKVSSRQRSAADQARIYAGSGKRAQFTSRHLVPGGAADFTGTPAQLRAAAEAAYRARKYMEVFYDPWGQYDNGVRSPRGIGGHGTHLHLSPAASLFG